MTQYKRTKGPVRHSAALALATAMLLAGCDFMGGVRREAKLEDMPDLACIREQLEQVPGVTKVNYLHVKGPREYEKYTYDVEGVTASLGIWQDSDGITYINWYRTLNSVPPEELVQRIRRKMIMVDSALEAKCHLKNLAGRIQESCPKQPFRDAKCE